MSTSKHDDKNYSNCYISSQEDCEAYFSDPERVRDLGLSFRWRLPREIHRAGCFPRTGDRIRDDAIDSIVAEALAAMSCGRHVSFSLRKGWWIGKTLLGGPGFTYANVRAATELLEREGWIVVERSEARKGGTGRQSVFYAADKLVDWYGIPNRPLSYKLREPILLRDGNGELMPLPAMRELERVRRRLDRLNEAMASVDLRIEAPDVEWTPDAPMMIDGRWYDPRRNQAYIVFNGDVRHGGRRYGLPYQILSQREHGRRDQLQIDDRPIDERDFSGCHPRALYHMRGLEPDGDLYAVPHETYGRPEAKLAMQILVNAKSDKQGVPALAWKLARGEAKAATEAGDVVWTKAKIDARAREHMKPCRDLCDSLKAKHAAIADAFFTGAGSRLQAVEAGIMTKAEGYLLDQGIVAFPMHDSAFVEAKHGGYLQDAMMRAYVETLGHQPVITAHQTLAA